jgi:hypothetical protein
LNGVTSKSKVGKWFLAIGVGMVAEVVGAGSEFSSSSWGVWGAFSISFLLNENLFVNIFAVKLFLVANGLGLSLTTDCLVGLLLSIVILGINLSTQGILLAT